MLNDELQEDKKEERLVEEWENIKERVGKIFKNEGVGIVRELWGCGTRSVRRKRRIK